MASPASSRQVIRARIDAPASVAPGVLFQIADAVQSEGRAVKKSRRARTR